MKTIKDELQDIILRDEQTGTNSQLKKNQIFLRRYAETGSSIEKQQRFQDEETTALIAFATRENPRCRKRPRLVARMQSSHLQGDDLSSSRLPRYARNDTVENLSHWSKFSEA